MLCPGGSRLTVCLVARELFLVGPSQYDTSGCLFVCLKCRSLLLFQTWRKKNLYFILFFKEATVKPKISKSE